MAIDYMVFRPNVSQHAYFSDVNVTIQFAASIYIFYLFIFYISKYTF